MMDSQTQLTEEEVFLLASTPAMIGTAMAFSESSGVFGTMKEIWASMKSQAAAPKEYPANQLIQSILPKLDTRDEIVEKAKQYQEMAKARLEEKGIKTQEQLRLQLIEDCGEVNVLLEKKVARQEAQEYKAWAMTVAENVAKASKEGGFLGFGGEQISAGEKELAMDISRALGTSTSIT